MSRSDGPPVRIVRREDPLHGVLTSVLRQKRLFKKMIAFSEGNIHDIVHFIRVWTYAKIIGELEGLDDETLFILEIAAITHDIACPLCREKYGNTNGKYQEEEGITLVRKFLSGTGVPEVQIERVTFLVGHHHTFTGIDSIDWQILVEADYIANATENGYSEQNIRNSMQKIMKTESGKRLLQSVFCICDEEVDIFEDLHDPSDGSVRKKTDRQQVIIWNCHSMRENTYK